MYCIKCGQKISNEVKFCPYCGCNHDYTSTSVYISTTNKKILVIWGIWFVLNAIVCLLVGNREYSYNMFWIVSTFLPLLIFLIRKLYSFYYKNLVKILYANSLDNLKTVKEKVSPISSNIKKIIYFVFKIIKATALTSFFICGFINEFVTRLDPYNVVIISLIIQIFVIFIFIVIHYNENRYIRNRRKRNRRRQGR